MTYIDWLDEVDGRLTRVLLQYPTSGFVIDPIRKHVVFALQRPEEVDIERTVRQTKGRLTAALVDYPDLEEHFMPAVEKATKAWGS